MNYDDLTPYAYSIPRALPGVQNIGWLTVEAAFRTGPTTSSFREKLKVVILNCTVNKTRGFHECDICNSGKREAVIVDGVSILLGAAEIWVPGADGKVYAAPDMVYHYVTHHSYLPPEEFLLAIENFRPDHSWKAEAEFERLIQAAYA